jgi:hypothetical protein
MNAIQLLAMAMEGEREIRLEQTDETEMVIARLGVRVTVRRSVSVTVRPTRSEMPTISELEYRRLYAKGGE